MALVAQDTSGGGNAKVTSTINTSSISAKPTAVQSVSSVQMIYGPAPSPKVGVASVTGGTSSVQMIYGPAPSPIGGGVVSGGSSVQLLYGPAPSPIGGGVVSGGSSVQLLYGPAPNPIGGGVISSGSGVQLLYGPAPNPIGGGVISSGSSVQLLYGASPIKPTGPIGGMQELYGPPPVPVGGIVGTGDRQIKISYEDMQNNSKALSTSANEMRDNWNNISKNILGKLSGSWGGSECEAYVSKIKAMESKMESSFKALELLADTYNKAINEASSTQDTVKRMIDSL